MNNEQKTAVIEAIGLLLEEDPDDSIPNVDKISEIVGFKVKATARDEALELYHKQNTDEPVADESLDVIVEEGDTLVTNNTRRTLPVSGVKIPGGETVAVPNFNAKSGNNRIWLKSGTISVG